MNRLGKTLTDEEAYEVLSSVMRFLYLLNLPPDAPLPEDGPPEDGPLAVPSPPRRASTGGRLPGRPARQTHP